MRWIKSPLNYTGGKYRLLDQIMPIFPANIATFADIFGGGFNVGINIANADRVIYNDLDTEVADLMCNFAEIQPPMVIQELKDIIEEYGLYFEKGDSDEVIERCKEGYLKLRDDYNKDKTWAKLYVLITCSFSNSISRSNEGNFNTSYGKRCLNKTMEKNLMNFLVAMHRRDTIVTSMDFRLIDYDQFTESDFVYFDPPYLNTGANYNKGWSEKEETDLYNICNNLTKRGIKWGISNDLTPNYMLEKFANENGYTIHRLEFDYSTCAAAKAGEEQEDTQEVLITNY